MPKQKEVKNYSKIKLKSKVRIEGILENKSCSTTWVDPKTVFESLPDPKKSPLQPQKVKITPKLSQIQNSELN